VQIRGGRGYETASSLKARGETPVPLERFLRDSRINTIFEGSSEIMRLFIAREVLDPHLKVSGAVLNSKLPLALRFRAALNAASFYARWYPMQWLPKEWLQVSGVRCQVMKRHLRYAARTSRRLARALFHAMVRKGPKLEREQLLLGRFVEIGTELFAIAATCLRADQLDRSGAKTGANGADYIEIADYFCRMSRLRIAEKFRGIRRNADRAGYKLAQQIVKGDRSYAQNGGSSYA
jgi:hypothetical protein